MSELTRREVLGRLAAAFTVAGAVDVLAAQDAHLMVRQSAAATGGRYTPKALSAREFRTLERLADLIIPPEDGRPGAAQADVAAWIDSLLAVSAPLQSRYTAGLAWIDAAMQMRAGSDFVSAQAPAQTALLDQIAFQRNRTDALAPGIDFFILLRRMTVDGFYTSPLGARDIYKGGPQATFAVPQAAIDHVLSRSPLK